VLVQIGRLEGCRFVALDGLIGKLEEVYFDDARWVARYLVVDTGGWLKARDVLITPHAVESVDLSARTITLRLSREKVRRSPDISTDLPVSRQYEAEYFLYYGYTPYWPTAVSPAPGAVPTVMSPPPIGRVNHSELERQLGEYRQEHAESGSLRSSSEVRGYHVEATDGIVGHVEDFLIDDETWAIRHLVVNTRNWLPGRRVIVAADAMRNVDWARGAVMVDAARDSIKAAPEFDPDHLPSGDYEMALSAADVPRR
jgi:hypothetical protein